MVIHNLFKRYGGISDTAAREVKPARDIPDLSLLKIELS